MSIVEMISYTMWGTVIFTAFIFFFSACHDSFELHVHLGQKTQAFLPEDLWKKVKNQLNVTLDNEDSELELGKDFNLDWVDGKGVITCIKETTVEFFIEIIQDFKIKGQTFGAYAKSHATQGQENKNEGIYMIFHQSSVVDDLFFAMAFSNANFS